VGDDLIVLERAHELERLRQLVVAGGPELAASMVEVGREGDVAFTRDAPGHGPAPSGRATYAGMPPISIISPLTLMRRLLPRAGRGTTRKEHRSYTVH